MMRFSILRSAAFFLFWIMLPQHEEIAAKTEDPFPHIENKELKTRLTNPKTHNLDLNNVPLSTKDLLHLSGILKKDKQFKRIFLQGNNMDREGAKYFMDGLSSNSSVQLLSIWRNPIGDDHLESLFDGLKKNSSITKLSLFAIGLTKNGMTQLCQAMTSNKSIENLRIHFLENEGAASFCSWLSKNNTLKTLTIHSHDLDHDTKVLKEALLTNTALERLRIVSFGMNETSAKDLATVIESNKSLKEMSFCLQSTTPQTQILLLETLKNNNITLHFKDVKISKEKKSLFQNFFCKNLDTLQN